MTKVLEDYLNEYYAALVVHKKDTTKIKETLKTFLQDTPENAATAKNKLAALTGVKDKCFISRIHAQILTETLNG